jgi:hypothetical protein
MHPTGPVTWIPCAERLPTVYSTVLVHLPTEADLVWIAFHDGRRWRSVDNKLLRPRVQAWAKLPEPPTRSL